MNSSTRLARRELGPLPAATTPAVASFALLNFDEVMQQFTAPLARAHAAELIKLGPLPPGQPWRSMGRDTRSSPAGRYDIATSRPAGQDTAVTRIVHKRLTTYFERLS